MSMARAAVGRQRFADQNKQLRARDQIVLTLEHRSAPAPDPIALVLATGDATRLISASTDETPPPTDRLIRLPLGPRDTQKNDPER